MDFFITRTRNPYYINQYGSNSKFLSMGIGSRVRIKFPEYGSSLNKNSTYRFLSTGPVLWVQR